MRHLRIISFYICMLALLFSCRQDELKAGGASSPNNLKQYASSITGSWFYSFPFYSSELVINDNGLFKFHNRGCMGHGYSEGSWTIENGDLILSSFDKFREHIEPISTSIQSPPITDKIVSVKKRKGKYEFTINPSVYNTTVSVKWPDTSNVFFDHVSYKLLGDTLYQLDLQGVSSETKFHQRKNNR